MSELVRRAQPVAAELLTGFRALVVNGPRQAGKSTLVRHLQVGRGDVANLDEPSLLDLARNDPVQFVERLPPGSAIDEFQRAGDPLLLAVKARLDVDRTPGQFVLAGSTQFLSTRSVSESLTGRVGLIELWPLSAGELRGTSDGFLEAVFAGAALDLQAERMTRAEYARAVAVGGFPELALGPGTSRFRSTWCEAYLQTVTAVANLAGVAPVRRPNAILPLLSQLAARSGGEFVPADLARDVLLDPATVRDYVDVLRTLYLVRLLPAWSTSHTGRAKRRSVAHLVDTALAAHLLDAHADDLVDPTSTWLGPLLESYVVNEVAKQASWVQRPVRLSHYRDRDQREVDLILERGRQVVGIEVKANSTPVSAHAKHLAFLRDRLGDRFVAGIVLHTGTHRLALGDRLAALPVSALWT
ncbi:MAG: ATP-binding protein [Sporichthyaceae bacterium]